MTMLLMAIRIIFTLISISYVVIFVSYLMKRPFNNTLVQLMIGDVDRNSLFYKTNQVVLDKKIRQVYWTNLVFIMLFTICLWGYNPQIQLILATLSLIAFFVLTAVDLSYRKLLRRLGGEA